MSEHIIEALGLSKVTIKDGKVIDVTEPEVEYCPLFDHHRGIKKLTPEVIAKNMQFRTEWILECEWIETIFCCRG